MILMPFVSPQKQPEVYFGTRVREMFARVKAVLDLIIGGKTLFSWHARTVTNAY